MVDFDRVCHERALVRRDLPLLAPSKPTREETRAATSRPTRPALDANGLGNFHHTTTPRSMVLAAFLLGLSIPAWVVLLDRKGHVTWAGRHTTFDPVARQLVGGLLLAMLGAYALGWLWWSVAASLNATNHAQWSVPVWVAPLGYFLVVGSLAAVPNVNEHVAAHLRPFVWAVGIAVAVVAHFGVLRSYRRTAESIGASTSGWSRVIALPWIALVFSVLLSFFGQQLDEHVFIWVIGSAWVLFYLSYAVSFYRAMATFDRACFGRPLTSADLNTLPEFLKPRT
jgi:hypothetical protein